jgi:vitamin B12 transporter
VKSGSIGNQNLQAETSLSYEIGADYFVENSFKISASVFQREQKEVIDYVTTAYANMPRKDNLIPTGTYALAKNISTVNTRGAELDLSYNKTYKKHSINTSIGFLFLKSNTSELSPSFYINSHAKFLTNFSLQYKYDKISIAFNGKYKQRDERNGSAYYIDISKDYFVLNAKLALSLLQNKWSVFAQIDNVLNRNYADILGAQMPRKWFMAGIQMRY